VPIFSLVLYKYGKQNLSVTKSSLFFGTDDAERTVSSVHYAVHALAKKNSLYFDYGD
jgi:hypothetical protein